MKRLILTGTLGLNAFLLAVTLTVFSVSKADAQDSLGGGLPPEIMGELNYAEQLNQWGMPDFAQTVLDKPKVKNYPGISIWLQRIKIQSLIAVGNFDEVKSVIAKAKEKDKDGLRLALADGYYAWGKYTEAQALYDAFFAKYPDKPSADLNDFFMESAYKYARMLLLMGDKPAALKAYRNALKAKIPSHIQRQIWSDTADLALQIADETKDKAKRDKLIKQAEDICDKILWVQDLWFGKAIVYLAHIEVLNGKPENAEKLINEYKDQLKQIDKILQQDAQAGDDLTALSPMAECRYLIGKMMHETAMQAHKDGKTKEAIELLLGKELPDGKRSNGALHHFVNVFIRYPSTSWAPDAGTKVDEVKKLCLEELGVKEITFKITDEQWEAVKKAQFQSARSLFNRNMFKEACGAYVKVLNLFPDGETSIKALSELTLCYIETEQDLEAEVTVRYISELFSKHEDVQTLAGNKVLSIATKYDELGKLDEKDAVHNTFFKHFTKHGRTASMLFQFGDTKMKEEDYAAALEYFKNIVGNHKKSNVYKHSLYKAALCYGNLGKSTSEIKYLQALVKHLEGIGDPDILILTSKFSIAQGYRKLAKEMLSDPSDESQKNGNKYMMAAASKYMELGALLTKADHPYKNTEANTKASNTVLEGSLFYKSYCYMFLTLPKDKISQYKAAAIKGYSDLVKRFPKSVYAPQALTQIATLYTLFGKADKSKEALTQLKKEHPGTPEADNADFALGMSLLNMGREREAIKSFKSMIQGSGKYKPHQILIVATELSKPEVALYDVALEAYEKALTMSEDRAIVEPALLGKGKCLTELDQTEKAVAVLDKLMTDYPKSGLTVNTGFYLARSASTMAMTMKDEDARFDMFNKAVVAIKKVQVYAKDDVGMKAKTNLEIGRIYIKKAEAEKEFGTEEKQAAYIEEAIATFQVMMMFADPRDPLVRPHLDDAFKEGLDLMFALERWDDVVQDAEKYLVQFKAGKHVSAVRSLKNKAVVKQRIAGGPATVAPEETEEVAPAE